MQHLQKLIIDYNFHYTEKQFCNLSVPTAHLSIYCAAAHRHILGILELAACQRSHQILKLATHSSGWGYAAASEAQKGPITLPKHTPLLLGTHNKTCKFFQGPKASSMITHWNVKWHIRPQASTLTVDSETQVDLGPHTGQHQPSWQCRHTPRNSRASFSNKHPHYTV